MVTVRICTEDGWMCNLNRRIRRNVFLGCFQSDTT